MHLTTSKTDALSRLNSLLLYIPFPASVCRDCRRGLGELLGPEMADAQWSRLTVPMQEWASRVLFMLPCMPWGARQSARLNGDSGIDKAVKNDVHLRLTLCIMELLSKARLLFHLFDHDPEAPAKRTHSILPVQLDHPDLCPYAAKPELSEADARSHSCVLLLLAPVEPTYLKKLYPQALLVNGGGIGGEFREKLGHRIALRMLLFPVIGASAPWVLIPTLYSEHLALAALSKLGGPRRLLLRHPHAVRFTACGGGEVALESDDLDDVLKVRFGRAGRRPPRPPVARPGGRRPPTVARRPSAAPAARGRAFPSFPGCPWFPLNDHADPECGQSRLRSAPTGRWADCRILRLG